ncbi:MAG: hypothetical protein OM95_14640 [Bdellovibrio sp. ArHS]|uniref:hypothetical protein n=1 Tax=Bdellovibrio sp. ArHS TaxID=1569284 RepID=UPI00058277A4|nr:hypothetical protein [Bdellovibrio sp. ArHS]KHD87418.1 MAG: hypothetical protein OM95_14640 [Bdellovibrio sp. ArHS]
MRRLSLLFSVFLLAGNSVAATIIDVDGTNVDFALDAGEKISVGDVLSLPENCFAKVTTVSGRRVSALLGTCADPSKIIPGIVANTVDVEEVEKNVKIDESKIEPLASTKESYFSIGLGLVFSPKAKMDFKYYSGATQLSGNAEFDFGSAISLNGEWSQFKKYSWNNGVLLSYVNMKLDKGTVALAGQSSSGTIADSDLSILTAAYAGKYRWHTFYLPVYAGLSNGILNSKDQFLKSVTTRVFVALGAGYVINDILNLETMLNVHTTYSAGGTYTSSSGTYTLVPEVGSLTYLQIVIKAIF